MFGPQSSGGRYAKTTQMRRYHKWHRVMKRTLCALKGRTQQEYNILVRDSLIYATVHRNIHTKGLPIVPSQAATTVLRN